MECLKHHMNIFMAAYLRSRADVSCDSLPGGAILKNVARCYHRTWPSECNAADMPAALPSSLRFLSLPSPLYKTPHSMTFYSDEAIQPLLSDQKKKKNQREDKVGEVWIGGGTLPGRVELVALHGCGDRLSYRTGWDVGLHGAGGGGGDVTALAHAHVDWRETDSAHIFRADLPGVRKEDLKVQVEDDNVLQISGEKVKEQEDKNDKWHRVERQRGSFIRRFRLPENAQMDQISCKMAEGVLTLTIPKKETPPQNKKLRAINVD
ncbi:uncharacterized protein LOC114722165 [Neltuma alba]|uniref:uncharacterized protein LOC114722165 n=1 Tax=Neltuma alba TaxID=207710 RepID=UPI0010A2C04E|nr:uncharacterized protein LOC114722165 [Prosopis alba]